jgi:tetratricopeptide (TPR) repeat protein
LANPSRVAIFDQNSHNLDELVSIFSSEGVVSVKKFSEGEKLWNSLRASQLVPELIVQDWNSDDVSGLALFNRIRGFEATSKVGMIITSDRLAPDEMTLLQEFPGTIFLPKPFTKLQVLGAVHRVIDEIFWIEQNKVGLEQVFSDLKMGRNDVKVRLFSIIRSSPNKFPLIVLAAKILRKTNHHSLASQLVHESLKIYPNEPILLTELAKIYFLEGKLKEAYVHAEKAVKISPKNLERLCFTGEVSVSLGKIDEAEKLYSKALGIDPENRVALAGVSISDANTRNHFSQAIRDNSAPQNLASLLNLAGIMSIRNGNYEDGFKQYRLALGISKNASEASSLTFNLGLGSIKAKRYHDADIWFKKCAKFGGRLEHKAKKYREIIELRCKGQPKQASEEILHMNLLEEFEEAIIGHNASEKGEDSSFLIDEEVL